LYAVTALRDARQVGGRIRDVPAGTYDLKVVCRVDRPGDAVRAVRVMASAAPVQDRSS
jgi:hypothetical protein